MLGNGGEAALAERLRGRVIADDGRILTHLASSPLALVFRFPALGLPRLDVKILAEVVKGASVVVEVAYCSAMAP